MKRSTLSLVAILSLAVLGGAAIAQRSDDGDRGPERRRGARPDGDDRSRRPGPRGPRRGFGPPRSPVFAALDADDDGELSAKEIQNATAALKALDKNKDGKLAGEEVRPQFRGRRGFGRGRGRFGGGQSFTERLMSLDKNEDGKVSKDEMPERMQRILERADANDDGALDKSEIERLAERFRGRGRRDRGGRRGADRSQRPERSDEDE